MRYSCFGRPRTSSSIHAPTYIKIIEWLRRYGPSEVAATIGEFGGAGTSYWMTGSFATAAVLGTIGASIGYYVISFWRATGAYYRVNLRDSGIRRSACALLLACRSLALEFGPAEVVDTLLVRPASWYVGLSLVGNNLLGWWAAKVTADIGFYACTIVSYEVNKSRLAPLMNSTESGTMVKEC